MPKLVIPVTKVDDTDVGVDGAVSVVEATLAIAVAGYYKIAADGVSLKWKLGAAPVTASNGSLLAAGDQEIIFVPTAGSTLRFITSQGSANAAGFINLTVANIQEIPGVDPRNMSA